MKPTPSPQRAEKHLRGKYKAIFKPEYHALIEQWYNHNTTEAIRHNFKYLVKALLDFNYSAARGKLRITYENDVIGANAIFEKHNGFLFNTEYAKKSVQWLSFATVADKKMYRETIGHISPAKLFTDRTQFEEDFNPRKKYTEGELATVPTKKTALLAEDIRPRSEAIEAECQVIHHGHSHYDTFFVWKVADPLKSNVLQKAHDATFKGAPWGEYGTTSNSNKTQWISVTNETFNDKDRYYISDEARRFQNYNDNFTHDIYKQRRMLKKSISMTKSGRTSAPPLLPDVHLKQGVVMHL